MYLFSWSQCTFWPWTVSLDLITIFSAFKMIVMTKIWTLVRKYEEVYVSNDFYNYFF